MSFGDPYQDESVGALIEAVRIVGQGRVAAIAAEVDRTQCFSEELWRIVAELGVPSLPFAEADGGLGAGFGSFTRVIAELAYFGAVAALYAGPTVQVASAVLHYGTTAQRDRWAEPLIAGKVLGAWAFTEPATGSDPKQIATTAVPTSNGWLINGTKAFVSFAEPAHTALVFAQTTPGRLGAFLVDTTAPGWQPQRPVQLLALGGMGTATVVLDHIEVPADALLGEPDSGFRVLLDTEAEGKVRAAATCLGIARRALDEAARYALQRTHRGEPIGTKFATIQQHLGSMYASVVAAEGAVRLAAECLMADDDPDRGRLAATARIVAGRAAREVTNDALQICGAYGMTQDMVVERLFREGKFYDVIQGVIEMQRSIVGKACLDDVARRGRVVLR